MDPDLITSIPLFSKILGISLSEIEYEKLMIKVKPENNNRDFYFHFFNEFKQIVQDYTNVQPIEETRMNSNFFIGSWVFSCKDHLEGKANQMDTIFNIIIAITSGLCLFSLSSTMSQNILEQNKELSLLLGLGFTKRMLLRLYVYESMVIILSSCVVGFIIGIFNGNVMIAQLAVF